MTAIYDAFQVFRQAQDRLKFDYPRPINPPITVEKVNKSQFLGEHNYSLDPSLPVQYRRHIMLSAQTWGVQDTLSVLKNARDAEQYRAWLVLHEFSHIFTKDRFAKVGYEGDNAQTLKQRDANLKAYVDLTVPALMRDVTDLNGGGFGIDRGLQTAYSSVSDKEALIEAVTGTLWNFGFSAITSFDEGAGGRSSRLGETTQDTYATIKYDLANVRCITSATSGDSLEQWVLRVVMGLESTPANPSLDKKTCS